MKARKMCLALLTLSCSADSSSLDPTDASVLDGSASDLGADVEKNTSWSVRFEMFERQATHNPTQTRTITVQVWYPNTQKSPPSPLILYSHGCGGRSDEASHLQEHLADHGFVVVGINHPGVSRTDCPRGCGAPDTPSCSLQSAIWERPDDVRAVREAIIAETQNSASFWFGRVDPSRIGMSGHSDGGSTTERVGSDPEFDALLLMAPSILFEENITNVRVPTFVINGGPSELPRAEMLFQKLEGNPRFLLHVTGCPSTGHWSFFDLEYTISKQEQEYPREVFHEYLRRFSTAFWNTYLKGSNEISVLTKGTHDEDRIVLLADP